MLIYILKSSACMAIFLLFYKLVLEKESIHQFKRYFLLGGLALSLVIPGIVFTDIVYIEPITSTITLTEGYSLEKYHLPNESSLDYTYLSIFVIYILGVLFFSFKFIKNLSQLSNTIKRNPKRKVKSFINVLLSSQILPHTFFNYIFLNKQKYEAKEIPTAVLKHEEAHATQKHSLDILLLEILQILYWFNPLIYFTKKAIKLNHEFLADTAVLNHGLERATYQNILLAFSSNATEPQLANAINYSSIKKRFTVMKKRTSKKVFILKSLLLIPLCTILLLGFSEKEVIEVQKETTIQKKATIQDNIKKELKKVDASKLNYVSSQEKQVIELYIKGHEILLNNIPVSLENLAVALEKEIHLEEMLENVSVEGLSEDELDFTFMGDIVTEINKTGVEQIKFCTSEYVMPKEDFKEHIDIGPNTVILQTDKITLKDKSIERYNTLAKKYNAVPIEKRKIPLKDLKLLETIYKGMSRSEKKEANPFPECLPKNEEQKPEFVFRISENRILLNGKSIDLENLSKEVDAVTKDWEETDYTSINPEVYVGKVSKGFLNRVDTMFKKTHYSKANGGIGLIPPPPPPPEAPKEPKVNKGEKSNIPPPPSPTDLNEFAVADKVIDEIIANQDPYDGNLMPRVVLKGEMGTFPPTSPVYQKPAGELKEVKKKIQEVKYVRGEVDTELVEPPAPPKPISPLDHVVEMAKKDAIFFYEGKKISSDKAIALLKKNNQINISTKHKGLKKPIVELSTKPIIIKK